MGDTSGTRFGLEAVFLVLLAVAVGFAGFRTWLIVVVMAGGWLLVALVEWLAWRASRPAPPPVLEHAQLPAPGWDVQEIIAPVVEEEAPVDEQTTVLRPEDAANGGEPEEPQPKRRWLRRARGAQ
jgi:hypothetical protein